MLIHSQYTILLVYKYIVYPNMSWHFQLGGCPEENYQKLCDSTIAYYRSRLYCMILVLEVALYMKFATGFSPESYIKKN